MADVRVNYEPPKAGWAKVALSPDILDACIAEAERGKAFAEGIAPRSGDGVGEPYADQFHVQPTTTLVFRRGPRVAAVLYNDSGHAAAVEFGNKRVPRAQRVLGRTAAYLGNE